MFKHYFERIQDIEIYPIISLSIFFLFFLSLLIWVLKVNNRYIQKMKHLPLEGETSLDAKDTLDRDLVMRKF